MSLLFAACQQPNTESAAVSNDKHTTDNHVMARVNGDAITAEQWQFAIDRTFSSVDKMMINDTVAEKLMESLVAARIMYQSAKATMGDEQQQHLALKVKAYEEELYIKEYLSRNVSPEPVTTAMVKEYYQRHKTEFGQAKSKSFEMLTSRQKPPEAQRNTIIQTAKTIAQEKDWASYAKQSDLDLLYKKGTSIDGVLDSRLTAVVNNLAVGKSSNVTFVDGLPVLIRVVAENIIPAKPLAEVSTTIRKRLAPLQLRKAVKAHTQQLIQQAEVIRY